jgi:hypothetical protein
MYEFTENSVLDDYKKMVEVLNNINRSYVRFAECKEKKERKYWWDAKYSRAPGKLLKDIEKQLGKMLNGELGDNATQREILYNKILKFLNIFMKKIDEANIYNIAIFILKHIDDKLQKEDCSLKGNYRGDYPQNSLHLSSYNMLKLSKFRNSKSKKRTKQISFNKNRRANNNNRSRNKVLGTQF